MNGMRCCGGCRHGRLTGVAGVLPPPGCWPGRCRRWWSPARWAVGCSTACRVGGSATPTPQSSCARHQPERVFGAGDPNLVLLVTAKRGSVDDPATAAVGATLTRQLVVGGPYRYVRNPMYLAVTAVIVGQALVLGQPGLLAYAGVAGGAMATFAHGHEEPTLRRQYGPQYQAYRQAVPAWWPRRHPWQPGRTDQPARRQL